MVTKYLSLLLALTALNLCAESFDEHVSNMPADEKINYTVIAQQVKSENGTSSDEELIVSFDQKVVEIKKQAEKSEGCPAK